MVEKVSISDLASLGGPPTFRQALHVNRPAVGDWSTFSSHLESVWKARWFTNNGCLVHKLEERLQNYLNVKHCILTCNGTLAMAITVRALNLSGEIILPSFTFISTPHILSWSNIKPVFCDVDPETWTIDPKHCASLINLRTSAIIGTHTFGRTCNTDILQKIAAQNGIALLFDAAHSFGCTHNQRMIGSFGDAEIFSFHATKAFHTGEGGAVTTNNDILAERIRHMRNFGFTDYDQVSFLGLNAKMPETSAALGLTNLDSIEELIDLNHQSYLLYQQQLSGIPGLKLRSYSTADKSNYHYICLDISAAELGFTRDQFVTLLHAENVLARRYFYPGCHRMQVYQFALPNSKCLPVTDQLSERVVVLPSGSSASTNEIISLCALIRFLAKNSLEIRATLDLQTTSNSEPFCPEEKDSPVSQEEHYWEPFHNYSGFFNSPSK